MSFEEDITRINTQIAALREQAEPPLQKFFQNTVLFLRDWSQRTVEHDVTSNPS